MWLLEGKQYILEVLVFFTYEENITIKAQRKVGLEPKEELWFRACNPRPLEEGILSKHLPIGLTILIPEHLHEIETPRQSDRPFIHSISVYSASICLKDILAIVSAFFFLNLFFLTVQYWWSFKYENLKRCEVWVWIIWKLNGGCWYLISCEILLLHTHGARTLYFPLMRRRWWRMKDNLYC